VAPARPLTALVGSALFTLFVAASAALFVPLALVRERVLAPWWPAGVLLVLLAAALYVWCAGLFSLIGRGTPAPVAAPSVFVARGPYRFVRNPMYIAVLCAAAGVAIAYGSLAVLAYAAVLAVGFHSFVLGYEEPTLARRFGSTYADYRRRVPRWLPRIAPRSHAG
jgi:protein-S-isoprenylcysteine O-methyltransferase Ste14